MFSSIRGLMTDPSNHSNLNDQVYSKIKNLMIMNQIVPGQKLQCQDLASLLRVSRTPVQNALSILAKEGFLNLIPNKGYYAKEITPEEIGELYQVREGLEILAVKNAVTRLEPGHLRALEARRVAFENDLHEPFGRKRFICDMEFHLQIAEIGGNSNLTLILRQVLEKIYFTYNVAVLSPRRTAEVIRDHQGIFRAIQERSVPGGIKIVRKHLKDGRDYLLRGLKSRLESLG